MPMSATKPIIAVKLSVLPLRNSAVMPPTMPSGMTLATTSVLLNVRNSSTRMARMPNTATMIAAPMPPKLSWRLSISPAGTRRYPAGSGIVRSVPSTSLVTRSVLKPVCTKLVTVTARCWSWCVMSVGDPLNPRCASWLSGIIAPVVDATWMRSSIALVGRPSRGTRTVMGYSSPSAARNMPASSPATPSRTVRSSSTVATPSRPAFWRSTCSARSVRATVSGLRTYCVPAVRCITCSTRAATARSESRSGPSMRMAMGASIGGPFSNSRTSMRAPAYCASATRSESSSCGVRAGSYACKSTNSWATCADSCLGDEL